MADQSPIIVPLVVEALVVNDSVRTGRQQFIRGTMQYGALRMGGRELPFQTDTDFDQPGEANSAFYNGVYLKWRLPDALTRGVQSNLDGVTTYPPVPNRWLVLRADMTDASAASAGAGKLTAWIVESDHINGPDPVPVRAADVGALYLPSEADPIVPVAISIGRNVRLDGNAWAEPGTKLGLTAVAPGNTLFGAFQPHNINVFSLIDPLDDYVDPATGAAPTPGKPAMFSYAVIGWLSDPADDPLHGVDAGEFADCLSALGWTLPASTDKDATASSCLVSGLTTGVLWYKEGAVPGGPPSPSDVPKPPPLTVAVGNNSVEALTALVAMLAPSDPKDPNLHPELFEAFQFGLIGHLDDADAVGLIAERLRLSSFKASDGGYAWTIVDDPDPTSAPSTALRAAPDPADEAPMLAALNTAQDALDEAVRQLAAGQEALFLLWWKWLRLKLPMCQSQGVTADQLVAQIEAAIAAMTGLRNAASPAAMSAAHDSLAAALKPSGRLLKRYSRRRFYQRPDPIVMVSGAGAPDIAGRSDKAQVRLASQIVSGIKVGSTVIDAATPSLALPALDLTGLSGVPWSSSLFEQLAQELFFRDPGNAARIAALPGAPAIADIAAALADSAAAVGVAPAGAGGPWSRNPWKPLMLLWEAAYYPINYGQNGPNWTYCGDHYEYRGPPLQGPAAEPLALQGRTLLTPQATVNLLKRIETLLDDTPDMPKDERDNLNDLLASVGDNTQWDLLSQALGGFNEQLTGHAPGIFARPAAANVGDFASLPHLVGAQGHHLPWIQSNPVPFQSWRAGQFVLTKLFILDEWGQALEPIGIHDFTEDQVAVPPQMTPQAPVLSHGTGTFAQLEPGLLQPARLDFDAVAASDDRLIAPLAGDVNPICGWVLPNHLDHALALYGPAGEALGELAVGIDDEDAPEVCWSPAPDSPYQHLPDLAAGVPHLGRFAQALHDQGPDEFPHFLAAIDETLWTTAPTGSQFDNSLAILFGRPLAMVRARLQLVLDGPLLADPSWVPTTSELPGYKFGIELGNVAKLDDGLVGYFADMQLTTGGAAEPDTEQYTTFSVVQGANAKAGAYLRPIGEDGNWLSLAFDGKAQLVSMLVDPRAPVHAITGILPDVTFVLPPSLVDAALAAMEVSFRVGPLMTRSRPPAAGGAPAPPVLTLPLPKLKSGKWAWKQKVGASWTAYDVVPVDPKTGLSDIAPTLREGLLTLSNDVSAGKSKT